MRAHIIKNWRSEAHTAHVHNFADEIRHFVHERTFWSATLAIAAVVLFFALLAFAIWLSGNDANLSNYPHVYPSYLP